MIHIFTRTVAHAIAESLVLVPILDPVFSKGELITDNAESAAPVKEESKLGATSPFKDQSSDFATISDLVTSDDIRVSLSNTCGHQFIS